MIKRIKSSDKTIRPFTTFKRWRHSTIDGLDSISLEQDLYNITDNSGVLIYSNKSCQEITIILKSDYETDICFSEDSSFIEK